jgi:hypothetical protein
MIEIEGGGLQVRGELGKLLEDVVEIVLCDLVVPREVGDTEKWGPLLG